MKGLRLGLRRALGQVDRPLGMTDEEFQELRARHEAGERSLAEAESQQAVLA